MASNYIDLGAASTLNGDVSGASSLSLGTNPSTTGTIRLPSDATVKFRNAANSNDYTLASLSSDTITLGGLSNSGINLNTSTGSSVKININGSQVGKIDSSGVFHDGYVAIGTTSRLPTTGLIRLSSTGSSSDTVLMVVKNNAASGEITVLRHVGSSDEIRLGDTTGNQTATISANPSTTFNVRISGTSRLSVTSTAVSTSVPISLQGSNLSTTGDIRGANATTLLAARNAANGANLTVIGTDSSDRIVIGDTTSQKIRLNIATSSTVGAAGAASAIPTPVGYITVNINGTDYKIPYCNT